MFTQSLLAQLLYGISDNNLIYFQAGTPSTILNTVPITGIANDQIISGLDFRPNTGELYTLGYNINTGAARLYTINLMSGTATPIGTTNAIGLLHNYKYKNSFQKKATISGKIWHKKSAIFH